MYTLSLLKVWQNSLQDEFVFYDDERTEDEYKILSARLTLEENTAGSLSLSVPPTNVAKNSFVKLETIVIVRKNGEVYWEGRVSEIEEDIWSCLTITCEGALTYLNDYIHPYFCYDDPELLPSEFMSEIVTKYKESIEGRSLKSFDVGVLNITEDSSADKIIRYTNYESTFEVLKKLIEQYGGFIYVTYEQGQNGYVKKLNWTDIYSVETNQEIRFGENLLDYSSNMSIDDFCTSVVALGKKLDYSGYDNVELYTTCKCDSWPYEYVYLTESDYPQGEAPEKLPIDRFGNIQIVKKWDAFDDPEMLVNLAKNYLMDIQFDRLKLELSAFDLSLLSNSVGSFELSEMIRVISPPHGLNRHFPVTKMSIDITSPEASIITLGGIIVRDGVNFKLKKVVEPSITNTVTETEYETETIHETIINDANDVEEYYPSGGWKTTVIDDIDMVQEDWTHFEDKDHRITEPGWYMLEGIVKDVDRTDGDQGVAIGIGYGWQCPGTLDGQSWRFEPRPPVARTLEEGTNEFYLDFLIWNQTSQSYPLYEQYALMNRIRIDVDSNREVTLVRYYVNGDDPSYWPSNMPNGYIDVYTDVNGWMDSSTISRRREIVYIFGGKDNENEALVKFFALSGFWEILTLDISDQGYNVPLLSQSICKNFVLFENMANKGLDNSRVYEYRDVWFSCKGFPGASEFHSSPPKIDCVGVRITEEAGVGVSKLEYISKYTGEYVTVYTHSNKWVNTNYRYIMIWYHEGRDSNDTFSQFLAHNSNQWFDLWGTRWQMSSLPPSNKSYSAGSTNSGGGSSASLAIPKISLANEYINIGRDEEPLIISSIIGGNDANDPNFIDWLNRAGLNTIEGPSWQFREAGADDSGITGGTYDVIGIITYPSFSTIFTSINVYAKTTMIGAYISDISFRYVYTPDIQIEVITARCHRSNPGGRLLWSSITPPLIQLVGGSDINNPNIMSWFQNNADSVPSSKKWMLYRPNSTIASNRGIYNVTGTIIGNSFAGEKPFNFINIGDENSIKVGTDPAFSSDFGITINFSSSRIIRSKIVNMSGESGPGYLVPESLGLPTEFEFGSTSLFANGVSSEYMNYAGSIELMSEVATLVSRRYMKPWYFIVTMHLINLVAKKEINLYMIEQDTIRDIHTSCITYLKRDDAVCLYGKAVSEGQHRTILKIHGPIA